MALKSCQPIGTDCKTKSSVSEANIFSAENRKRCEKYVRSIQRKLNKAVANNDKESSLGINPQAHGILDKDEVELHS